MAMTSGNDQLMSQINVTPLVDVMLVLLIIFMVTAPMMMQGVDVALPQSTSSPLPADSEHLVISIDKKQDVYINDFKVHVEALQGKLLQIHANRPDQQVLLRADREVPYGLVVRVMSEIKDAGVDKLGVITEPVEKTGKPTAR